MHDVLAAAGSLRDSYAAVDWAAAPIGPPATWSPALKSAVTTALQTRFPVTLLWGPEYTMLYNEAYVAMIGDKHPTALGSRARDVFPELWGTIGPMLDSVTAGAGATWVDNLRMLMDRHGYLEECFFTFSYSAVLGEDGAIEGVIDIAAETTAQVVGARRLDLLRRLHDTIAQVSHPDHVRELALPLLHGTADLTRADLSSDTLAPDQNLYAAGNDVRVRLPGADMLTVQFNPQVPVDDAALGFVRLLAAALTQAFDRARTRAAEHRLGRMERELSGALQHSLLTPPAQADGLQVAVRYQTAVAQAHIGGDWYDSFLVPGGQLTLAVGDVSGHDRHAAAGMAQLRNLLRGTAIAIRRPPSEVLTALDHAMSALAVDAFATALLAQVEEDTLRWSSAGHPPPVLLNPDGSVRLLSTPADVLLGTRRPGPRQDHVVTLEPGSSVVLYTDGLVERRHAALDDGLRQLTDALAGQQHLDAEQLCDHLLARFAQAADDDIVLLVLQVVPPQ
ncbi:PP2C family protein-serine/threonine phosphatase [Actinoplanes sp. NPDC051859]|uniref:PP2C family protein-serine/threonine phosphatase n=1 Tax=Actinoplanes sp. NPDC051859 TaxID=3363909 RepID=UPI0037A8F008